MEKQETKAPYVAPELVEYGDIKTITLGGGFANSDDGQNANNAYPNPS